VGPRAYLHGMENRYMSWLLPEFKFSSSAVQPVAIPTELSWKKIYAVFKFLIHNLYCSPGIINVNTCIGVKLGFSPCGRILDWGCRKSA
jgi:hypothetical protein